MPDQISLVYFNSRGRAEPCRMMLAYGGIAYEDKRLTQEEWQKLKPSVPTRQLPMLVVNGTQICQSGAMERYIAKKAGLLGDNDLEAARIDMMAHTVTDLMNKYVAVFMEKDETRKAALKETANNEHLPQFLSVFEEVIKANGGEHMVGNKLSYPEVGLNCLLAFVLKMAEGFDLAGKFPLVSKVVDKVNNTPAIKKWIEERPVTDN